MYLLFVLFISTYCINFVEPACTCSNPEWCKPLTTPPRKEVFTFQGDSWRDYDYSIVTTIGVYGNIPPELVCYAHSKGVRVVKAASDFPQNNLTNPQDRTAFLKNLLNEVISANADGLNLDIEGLNKYRDELTAFVTEAKSLFSNAIPRSQISFDTSIYPSANDPGYDYVALSKVLDFFFVMAYDMCWGTSVAEANSPIDRVTTGIQGYLNLGIPSSKVVLGLPWYGYDFPCTTTSGVCRVSGPFTGDWQISYGNIMKIATSTSANIMYDSASSSMYFDYTKDSRRHQIWFDNSQSLTPKYRIVTQKNLRGIGTWSADELNYDNKSESQKMWDALRIAVN